MHQRAKNYVWNPEISGFKAWNANGQSLRSQDERRQVSCIRPSNAPGESERTGIIKTQDAAECHTHHADVRTRGGRMLEMKYAEKVDEDASDLGTEVDHARNIVR